MHMCFSDWKITSIPCYPNSTYYFTFEHIIPGRYIIFRIMSISSFYSSSVIYFDPIPVVSSRSCHSNPTFLACIYQ